jgi:glutamine amidotransferase
LIAIVDYGMGNVASVANMLRHIHATAPTITRDPDVVRGADRVVLPGVGSFETGMQNLAEFGLIDALNYVAFERRVPVLGICLGMQLFTRSSEEGQREGLGWFDALTVRFRFEQEAGLKIPHMGWSHIRKSRANALLADGEDERFYFVHSYHVICANDEDVIGVANYGFEFTCAVNRDNVFGVQFHPEKSHKYGMSLLRKFVSL